MHSVDSFAACFCERKSWKELAHFAWAIDSPKRRIFKMLQYLDYLVFLHAFFCTEQLYAFRRFIFSMVLQKKKLKITGPFAWAIDLPKCVGYFMVVFFPQYSNHFKWGRAWAHVRFWRALTYTFAFFSSVLLVDISGVDSLSRFEFRWFVFILWRQ